jgi:hypothetical protein
MVLNDVPWASDSPAASGRPRTIIRPKPLVPPTSPTALEKVGGTSSGGTYGPSSATTSGGRSDPKRVPSAPPAIQSPTQLRATPDAPATPRRPAQPPYRQPYGAAISPAPRTGLRQHPATVVLREEASSKEISARVRVLMDVGGAMPVTATLALDLPAELQRGASVLWTDNGQPVGTNGVKTRAVLREPGTHRIEALIVTPDDRHFVVAETVEVAAPEPTTRPSTGS